MQSATKEEIGGIKMDTNQYMEMFLEESREHLQSLNDGLLALENDPEEVSVVNDIFRNAHTIKGMSATMGFTKIAELTHDMENVFDLLRTEKMKVNEDIMDTLFKTIDSLEQMIESVGSGGPEDVVDITGFASKLSALASGKTVDEAEPAPAKSMRDMSYPFAKVLNRQASRSPRPAGSTVTMPSSQHIPLSINSVSKITPKRRT